MRDGLIFKSEACREHHAAGDLGADRRQTLKQIEGGKAFHKSAGDGCKNFAVLRLCSMDASICAAAGLLRPHCAGVPATSSIEIITNREIRGIN